MTPTRTFLTAALFASVLIPQTAAAAETVSGYVAAAVGDGGRIPWDVLRDPARQPQTAMMFSGIKPGQVVVDFMPGDGYYTRILSQLVGPKGKVLAFIPYVGENPQFTRAANAKLIAAGKPVPARPVDWILAISNTAGYENVTAYWESLTYYYGAEFGLPEQVDAVWARDSYHTLHSKQLGDLNPVDIDKAVFRAMKNGGTYTVIEHASAKGAGFTQADSLARVEADAVKAEMLSAGFVLDAESSAFANTSDDHTKSAASNGPDNKSDEFALRFKKPANAPNTDQRPKTDPMKNYYGNTFIFNIGAPSERHSYYHPDRTYQEFGNTGTRVQEGTWYWDADGHNCQLHQFPADERGFIVCHSHQERTVGKVEMQANGNTPALPVTLAKGLVPMGPPKAP